MACAILSVACAGAAWPAGHGGHSGGGHSGGHFFHHGARARVFISSPAFFYPGPYYYYPGPGYAPAAPVEYIQQDNGPGPQYWYFCPASRAYYPYVNECPGGWQLIQPADETVQPSFPG